MRDVVVVAIGVLVGLAAATVYYEGGELWRAAMGKYGFWR